MNAMNERMNNFRSVTRAEVEADHLFKATRHFPELRQSMRNQKMLQVTNGRDMATTQKYKNEKRRPITLKSTNRLDKLTGSCLGELTSMTSIRGVLMSERDRQRELRQAEREGVGMDMGCLTPLARANMKLTKVSVSFNAQSSNNDLSGFQSGLPLSLNEFDRQLRRCLNITLTREELEDVFANMDADGSGDIDGVEFTRYFFKLGSEHKAMLRLRETERLEVEARDAAAVNEREAQRRLEWEAAQIGTFTPEEEVSATAKLSRRAYHFDHNHFIDMLLTRDFNCHLSPYQFISQLQESFGLYMTVAENGALVARYRDRDGLYCIDGHHFVNDFKVLQRHEHDLHAREAKSKNGLRVKHITNKGQYLDYQSKSLGR
jgi:hypothetical protein